MPTDKTVTSEIIAAIAQLLRAYSSILFLDSAWAGFFIALVTFFEVNVGTCGLISALTALMIARLLQFPKIETGLHLLNSLLVGLALGAFYLLSGHLLILILIASALTVVVSAALIALMETDRQLPVLSLPFLIVITVVALAAQQNDQLIPMDAPAFTALYQSGSAIIGPSANQFLMSLGATFFTSQTVAGAVILLVIAIRSRYLALLALAGYLTGYCTLWLFLDIQNYPLLLNWTGFNFTLVAIALGGIYMIPGIASFTTALLAAALCALILIATQKLLFVYGLPVLALPFVVTTLIFLIAMKARLSIRPPWLAPQPNLPEINYENARLARVRNGAIHSVPLLPPFLGKWQIYQGFNGPHTHKGPWRYALDFYIKVDDQSFQNNGATLKDFYCFGLPVVSPAHGQVIRIQNSLADNPPGEVDTKNNWGNFILIRLDNGFHLLLAHLQNSSISVSEGARIKPGEKIARCGNSGRSPQPHLHMQIQETSALGSRTYPFHLQSIVKYKTDGLSEYLLVNIPEVGDCIEAATIDDKLAKPLHMPVGRQLTYEYSEQNSANKTRHTLTVELTLSGQFRLVSGSGVSGRGASAAFMEANGVLAFFDRQGPKDPLLDLWLLANGLTPLAKTAHQWQDSPSAQLFPANFIQRFFQHCFRPLGCGLTSHYTRHWSASEKQWRQQSVHQLQLPQLGWEVKIESLIDPVLGCCEITLHDNEKTRNAVLIETGLSSDEGIPSWHIDTNPQLN